MLSIKSLRFNARYGGRYDYHVVLGLYGGHCVEFWGMVSDNRLYVYKIQEELMTSTEQAARALETLEREQETILAAVRQKIAKRGKGY